MFEFCLFSNVMSGSQEPALARLFWAQSLFPINSQREKVRDSVSEDLISDTD